MKRILITGAFGQVGSELVTKLRKIYGNNNVIATDIKHLEINSSDGPFEMVDVTAGNDLFNVAKKYNVDTIMHMAALLSAISEEAPQKAWDINMGGLVNALEVARQLGLAVFTPSSIGAFGPSTPKDNTPQDTLMRPNTMYGVNKVSGELLCDYYHSRYGVDTRGVRFPGLISYKTEPGGGTTDYAVEIYHEAIHNKSYTSFIDEHTKMDMMYMPDAINAIIDLMEANPDRLLHRNAFNVTSFSASPADFARAIRKHIPDFQLSYDVDPIRQHIAESWPNHIDASAAIQEWDFNAKYGLDETTEDMLNKLAVVK